MLIETRKHDADELQRWRALERQDALVAQQRAHLKHVDQARRALERFASSGTFYVSVSWGKDSVCLAHLAATVVPDIPLIWVRIEPVFNPECLLVRDAFLKRFPDLRYDEVVVEYFTDETRWTPGFGPEKTRLHSPAHRRGFRIAESRYGSRYASGICAHESGIRRHRMQACGYETKNTCAPMGWWRPCDVFAYLYANELPVHPAYAYTMHGAWERERIRVDALWGPTGIGHGRREWERRYYPEQFSEMRKWCAQNRADLN